GALRAETMAFRKPVLLVHGDSGRFGIDKPMVAPNGTTVANFTRLQTFGPADAGWVRVGVDPAARDVFSFRAEIPPGAPAAPPADHSFAADNLFRQVRALGRQARSYQEDMPGRCVLEPSGLYVVKHNPAPYYKGGDDRAACQRDNLPLGSTAAGPFASALDDGTLPAFSFVT